VTKAPHLDENLLREVAETCVCANLRRLSRTVTQLYETELRPTGLRATQVTLLVALGLAKKISITRLGEILQMDRTTLTRNLGPLERDALIALENARDDVRRKVIRLTPKGARTLSAALPRWRTAQRRALAQVGPARWERLNRQLRSLMP
jgi:DNA-binding MarR family transcriptional regulator